MHVGCGATAVYQFAFCQDPGKNAAFQVHGVYAFFSELRCVKAAAVADGVAARQKEKGRCYLGNSALRVVRYVGLLLFDDDEGLALDDGIAMLGEELDDLAVGGRLDLVEELHGFNDADRLPLLDAVAFLGKLGLARSL